MISWMPEHPFAIEYLHSGELHKQLTREGNIRVGFWLINQLHNKEEQPVSGGHVPSWATNLRTSAIRKARVFISMC